MLKFCTCSNATAPSDFEAVFGAVVNLLWSSSFCSSKKPYFAAGKSVSLGGKIGFSIRKQPTGALKHVFLRNEKSAHKTAFVTLAKPVLSHLKIAD